jgi:hypothetical protein
VVSAPPPKAADIVAAHRIMGSRPRVQHCDPDEAPQGCQRWYPFFLEPREPIRGEWQAMSSVTSPSWLPLLLPAAGHFPDQISKGCRGSCTEPGFNGSRVTFATGEMMPDASPLFGADVAGIASSVFSLLTRRASSNLRTFSLSTATTLPGLLPSYRAAGRDMVSVSLPTPSIFRRLDSLTSRGRDARMSTSVRGGVR